MVVLNDMKLGTLQKGHIFYPFKQEDAYIRNLMLFIQAGLENNQHMQEGLLSVCAYRRHSLSSTLTDTLEMVHQYVLTDEDLQLSMTYRR
jgi:hypothetical protein